jgi:N-acetylglucosamine-6-phosphate deacetylase
MLIRNVCLSHAMDEVYSIKDVIVDRNGQISILDADADLADPVLQDLDVIDAQGRFTMMPGLLDAHVHGQGGVDFADVGEHPERLSQMMAAFGQTGVSYVMATLVSLQIPTLTKALQAIDAYIQEQSANPMPGIAQIVGVHLEGPFIARNCKGAHDGNALQDSLSLPQFRQIIAAAPSIKEWKMTIAPDLPGAEEFIHSVKDLEKEGISVKIFIGHSNPDTAQIDRGVKAGAAGFTHLGNACMETCCREARKLETSDAQSNIVKWVLNNPDTCPAGVELIVDGVHLSQPFVNLVKDKIDNKIMLVTDALGPAGLSDGQYNLGTLKIRKEGNSFYLSDPNGDFIMKDGTLADGSKGKVKSLAGSAAPMSHCIETYYRWMGQGERVPNRMAAIYSAVITNPRNSSLSTSALQKLNDDKNFVIFNEQGQLVMSLCHGRIQHHLPELQLTSRIKNMIVMSQNGLWAPSNQPTDCSTVICATSPKSTIK